MIIERCRIVKGVGHHVLQMPECHAHFSFSLLPHLKDLLSGLECSCFDH